MLNEPSYNRHPSTSIAKESSSTARCPRSRQSSEEPHSNIRHQVLEFVLIFYCPLPYMLSSPSASAPLPVSITPYITPPSYYLPNVPPKQSPQSSQESTSCIFYINQIHKRSIYCTFSEGQMMRLRTTRSHAKSTGWWHHRPLCPIKRPIWLPSPRTTSESTSKGFWNHLEWRNPWNPDFAYVTIFGNPTVAGGNRCWDAIHWNT